MTSYAHDEDVDNDDFTMQHSESWEPRWLTSLPAGWVVYDLFSY